MWHHFVTPRSVIAATVVASVAAASTIGFMGYQSYEKARAEAVSEMREVTRDTNDTFAMAYNHSRDSKNKIEAAKALLASSESKTLDSVARDALAAEIAASEASAIEAERVADELSSEYKRGVTAFNENLFWPPRSAAIADELSDETEAAYLKIHASVGTLDKAMKAVEDAVVAWQAEQDRIAAEKAKAAAAARRASGGGTSKPSSGSTTPNVIAAPPAPAAPTGWSAQGFLGQYLAASEYSLDWDPALCQPGYICGTTLFSNPPLITLMGTAAAPANYDFGGGRYVLIHEAAHVKQYWYYTSRGGNYAALLAVVPAPPASWTRPPEYWPLEYMADCSTTAKFAVAGTYMRMAGVSSCTPEQMAEAAKVW